MINKKCIPYTINGRTFSTTNACFVNEEEKVGTGKKEEVESVSVSEVSSTKSSNVPQLVNSRDVADYEGSTVPDTWYTSSENPNQVEYKESNLADTSRRMHDLLGMAYTEVDETTLKNGKPVKDWGVDDVEKTRDIFMNTT